jgi:hypothetical protein
MALATRRRFDVDNRHESDRDRATPSGCCAWAVARHPVFPAAGSASGVIASAGHMDLATFAPVRCSSVTAWFCSSPPLSPTYSALQRASQLARGARHAGATYLLAPISWNLGPPPSSSTCAAPRASRRSGATSSLLLYGLIGAVVLVI